MSDAPDPDLSAERELVERAQAGDRDALGALLRRHGPRLYRSVLLPRLGSPAAAEDALAQTYLKVVERVQHFAWQGVGFYPWLRTVALHVAIDSHGDTEPQRHGATETRRHGGSLGGGGLSLPLDPVRLCVSVSL